MILWKVPLIVSATRSSRISPMTLSCCQTKLKRWGPLIGWGAIARTVMYASWHRIWLLIASSSTLTVPSISLNCWLHYSSRVLLGPKSIMPGPRATLFRFKRALISPPMSLSESILWTVYRWAVLSSRKGTTQPSCLTGNCVHNGCGRRFLLS